MNRFDRRKFIGGAIATAAALRSSTVLADDGGSLAKPAEKPDLVEVSGTDRKAMVKAALDAFGGIGAFVSRGQKVVIKPNIAFANLPAWATGTHPDTLVAVAQACLDAGAKEVLVLENPLNDPRKCLERTGAEAALKPLTGVKLHLLSDHDEFKEVAIPKGVALKSTEVAKAILEADVFINLPQAKHHSSTGVSFGLKNAMGAIWSRKPFHLVYEIHQAIADLGQAVRPTFTLLDATHVLLTAGPKGPGDIATPGKMILGRAIASVDAWGLGLAKFGGKAMTPADARHIALASAAGLGSIELSKLKVLRVTT